MSKRFLREQDGFTLPEMLVTTMVMISVLFALYNIFDMSMRVFEFANDRVNAAEKARLGLQRMEREIRVAHPVHRRANQNQVFITSATNTAVTPTLSPTSITFGNELGAGNDVVDAPAEVIRYSIASSNLVRTEGTRSSETVAALGPTGSLNLTYLQADGATPATSEGQVQMVGIALTIDEGSPGDPKTQTLSTRVDLRNRGG